MKIKRVITFVLIFALILAFAAFLAGCKEDEKPKDDNKPPEIVEYPDEIIEIGQVKVSASKGDGYVVKHPSKVEKGGTLRFEVEVFENYSKDTLAVSVNGTTVSGDKGIYEIRVSDGEVAIVVSGVNRTHCSVEYDAPKGVAFSGEKRIAVGETLEFTMALDENAVKTNDFKITANGKELTLSDGKYSVANVSGDLQISAVGVDYPKFSVNVTEGEGYVLSVNATEIYKGDDLYVFVELESEYVLKSDPVVYANGIELERGGGAFILRNVSQDVTLTVSGIEKVRSYTVSFENTNEEYPDVDVEFGKSIEVEIANPRMDGRTFVGWSANGEIVPLENFVITDDVTLEAVWNYNYKDEKSTVSRVHAFSKDEVLKMGEAVPSGRVGYGNGVYQQNADWEAFRIFDDKEGGAFSVTFPKFAFNKYGYVEFRFSTIWSKKAVLYNGTPIASVTNGGNLDNYLEIFVSDGYIGCGNVKVQLKNGVYSGEESLVLDVDNGKGRHGVFSDFYTYEYDYRAYIEKTESVTEATDKETARGLFAEYKKYKNFLTSYEKTKYSFLDAKASLLKRIAMPIELSSDGSFVSAKLNGEEKNPNNAAETPGGSAASMGLSKRWTLTNVTDIDLVLQTVALESDEKIVYTIAFQSGSFPYNISIGETEVLSVKDNLVAITVTIHGNGTVTIGNASINVGADVTGGNSPLTLKITKSSAWGNIYVSHKVLLDVE